MTDVAISALPAQSPVASTAILPLVQAGATKQGTVADVVKGGGAVLADGTVAFTANQSAGGHKHTNLANGNPASQDAATVAQTEALIAASISNVADWKQSVRFATTTALPASTLVGSVRTANSNGAFPTVDGVTAVVGDRFLDKDHATGSVRGIYTVTNLGSGGTPWVVTRAVDCDASSEVTCGLTVLVEEGTVAAGKPFILTTANPITLGTTSLTFTALSSASADGTTLSLSGGVMSIAALGVGTSQLASDGVTFAKMQNIATDSLIGRDTASTGDPENILLDAATLQMDGSGNLRVPSQLGARSGENIVIDLYPSMVSHGTITSAAPVNFDYAIGTGKHYDITAKVYVDDGSGTGACLYLKKVNLTAHQTGGAAVIVGSGGGDVVVVSAPLEGGSYTFTVTVSTTNVRFTLTKTNGGTDSYNLVAGDFHLDKP